MWGSSTLASDRMLGYCELTAAELLQEDERKTRDSAAPDRATTHPLLPDPNAAKSGLLSVWRTKNLGTFSVHRAEVVEGQAKATGGVNAVRFDLQVLMNHKKATSCPPLVPLSERLATRRAAIQRGLIAHADQTALTRVRHAWSRFWARLHTRGWWREIQSWNFFHQIYLTTGSMFGSGIQCWFGFALHLMRLNLILAVVWVPLVIVPQVVAEACGRPSPSPHLAFRC